MKLVFKILGGLVILIIAILIAVPFFLEKNIDTIVRRTMEGQVNAMVDYGDIDLSLIKNFPKAQLQIQELKIINKAPFEGDTLVYAKSIAASVSYIQLFKGFDTGIKIDKIKIDEANINVLVNKEGKGNYDIAIEDKGAPKEVEVDDEKGSDFKLNLDYEINNSTILYRDESSKMEVAFNNLTHTGKGDVSSAIVDLATNTETNFHFMMGGVNYAKKMPISLKALIGVDQEKQRYTFKENHAKINQIPLIFEGFVQQSEKSIGVDISFKSENASFKDLLASIPGAYKKDLKGVSANGVFDLHGMVKGISDDKHIPKLLISLKTENANFKYPDLPMGVNDITIITDVKNNTGNVDDTFVDIKSFKMKIGEDQFVAKGKLSNLSKNLTAAIKAKGTVNLAHLNKAYPVSLDTNLEGIIKADIESNFNMNAIEKEQYQDIKSIGDLELTNFNFNSEELPNAVKITSAKVAFNPSVVALQEFKMTSGNSDLSATGSLENLIPFVLSNKVLKGDFNLNSKNFVVQDFLSESSQEETGKQNDTSIEKEIEDPKGLIPSFLDITSKFDAKAVTYGKLMLKNTKGKLSIKDQKAILENMTTDIFGGQIGFDGVVNTQKSTPIFDMKLDMKKLSISDSFQSLEMLQKLTPIASALNGLFSSKLNLKGSLKQDLSPNLNSLKGLANANLINAKVDPSKNNLISSLNGKTEFLDLGKLNLKDLAASFNFEEGKIKVKPFDFKLKDDIGVTINGGHTFDAGLDYDLKLNIPAKYLSSISGGLLNSLSDTQKEKTIVPLPITLGGTFKQPKVGLDMKGAISNLTKQVVANQKQALKQKATKKIKSEISKKISGSAKDVLGGLLGGKQEKKTEATTNAKETGEKPKEAVKEAAGKLLKGLFNKK